MELNQTKNVARRLHVHFRLAACNFFECKIRRSSDYQFDAHNCPPSNSRLNVVVRFLTPFGVGWNGCWLSRGSIVSPGIPSSKHSFGELPSKRPQKGSTQSLFFPASLFPVFLYLFSSFFEDQHRLSKPWGPLSRCSVCARNAIWRDKSVQCYTTLNGSIKSAHCSPVPSSML